MLFRKMCAAGSALFVMLLVAGVTRADYILTPLSGGSGTLNVAPGDSFNLDVVVTATSSDVHNSAIFRVVFSQPGLLYTGYAWQLPYTTTYDDSKPNSGLPVLIDAATLSGLAYPENDVDIEMSNVVGDGTTFTTGTIVTLGFTVPSGYSGSSPLNISVAPDTIANGFDVITTRGGEDFILNVVPESSTLAMLLIGGAALLKRRAAHLGIRTGQAKRLPPQNDGMS